MTKNTTATFNSKMNKIIKEEPREELVTPPTSPTIRSEEDESSGKRLRRFKILRDIYQVKL